MSHLGAISASSLESECTSALQNLAGNSSSPDINTSVFSDINGTHTVVQVLEIKLSDARFQLDFLVNLCSMRSVLSMNFASFPGVTGLW